MKKQKRKRGDFLGMRYGKLVVIKKLKEKDKRGRPIWLCICDCGKRIKVKSYSLTRKWFKKSCGCIKPSLFWKMQFYNTWAAIKDRCYNKKSKDYKNYGKRGINVCPEWANDYMAFHNWAKKMHKPGLSLDRINNNLGYSPQNCRYSTSSQQVNNRRNTVYLFINGETKSLKEWSCIYNIKNTLVYKRINSGWDIMDSLTKPSQRGKSWKIITD